MAEPKYTLPRVMTVRELSSYLRVHPSTIYKLYALAARLQLPRDATAKQLAAAMRGRILAIGEMIATFER